MRDGFVSVAAVTPSVRVADVEANVAACAEAAVTAVEASARVVVLPELCLTAYTCEDLFWQDALLVGAERGLAELARLTSGLDAVILAGLPVCVRAKLYNCAAVLCRGEVLGLVPKRHVPTYNEFYEGRRFTEGPADIFLVDLPAAGLEGVAFGGRQLFRVDAVPGLVLGVELCEDLWVPNPPSVELAQAGATLICNLSASNEVVGKSEYRRSLVSGQSARLVCGYVYASAGWGESTQDLVFGGHDLVCENGRVLAESAPLAARPGETVMAMSELDVSLLAADRRRMSTFEVKTPEGAWVEHRVALKPAETVLTRVVDPDPFVPAGEAERASRCERILAIQAQGLARRLQHTHSKKAVVGVSGGLDSTLALLVCARALDLLGLPRETLLAITMPGFGTTHRTHDNARTLAEALGAELREISIANAACAHLADIGRDDSIHDVTYENAQARERTQVLMDVANMEGGLVVGTGDLSELALGWATYNADHMSMYGVNAGVPKTLVRHLVRYMADTCGDERLNAVLLDVLDTPVSPELLPASADGTIAQRTEDLVGPYELHDFVLYNVLRCGFSPRKVYRLARRAFGGEQRVARPGAATSAAGGSETFDDETILKWLKVFYRRFFSQQFKRSCLPDGPKVGSVAVSPRGDLRMPSDASAALWQRELEEL